MRRHHQFYQSYLQQFDNPAEGMARLRVHHLRRFYQGIIMYLIVVPMLFAINYINFNGHWWAVWPALFMTVGGLMKATRVLGWSFFWNDAWEDKKVEEILARKGK